MPRFAVSALGLCALLCGAPVLAGMGAFTRFGGGRAHTDCALVTDVAGAAAARPSVATCTDGDPACDADATADGSCTFAVRVCFGAPLPGCPPEAVTHAELRKPAAALSALSTALAAVTMPVTSPDTCTDGVHVPVALAGHRTGRLVVRGTALMASGHGDRDRLVLSCKRRPATRPATFATLRRDVFARSCASFSCHGAGGAGGLDLSDDAAYARLVGVAPANDGARAAGLLRVAPGDPERSFLLRKLVGSLAAGEGERMPRVGVSLPAARIDLVRRWILAGAPVTDPF